MIVDLVKPGTVVYHPGDDETYVVYLDHGDGTGTVEAEDGSYCTFFWNELRRLEKDE